jgi:hypothetical protein
MNTLLAGKSKTGHTYCFNTLPGGLVDFSFDKGGYHSLIRPGKNVTVVNSFRDWLATGKKLGAGEILVINYEVSDPILVSKYTGFSVTLLMNFIIDFNELWKPEKIKGRGICHVAIDSLTGMQRPVLEYIVASQSRETTSQNDYGLAIFKVQEIVSSGIGLPQDFILTTHIQSDKDEATGEIKETPLIFGKSLPDILLAMFDTVFLTTTQPSATGGLSYKWQTQPTAFFKSVGTRSFDNLPTFIEPNFEKLFGDRLYKGDT